MDALATTDPADAPREPSYADRVRAARQADLQRRLADAAEHDRQLAARNERAAATASGARRFARLGAPALVLAIVAAAIWLSVGRGNDVIAGPPELHRPNDWPSLNRDSSDAPLGTPPPLPAASGVNAFISSYDDRSPVTWDPCRPIHYVVNPARQPLQGDRLIREAVERASVATGLHFVDDGITDETWTKRRAAFQEARYGDRWAPVLIVWSNGTTIAELAPVLSTASTDDAPSSRNPAGIGGPITMGMDKSAQAHVSGQIALDVEDLSPMLAVPGGFDRVRAVIMHELGHVIGLDHVEDPTQIMNSLAGDVTEWGPGDLRGLHALATGECHPEI